MFCETFLIPESRHPRPPPRRLPYSEAQFVCDGENGLQDGHEARHLAEAATAHHLHVHSEALLEVSSIHTAGHLVEPGQNLRRELWRETCRLVQGSKAHRLVQGREILWVGTAPPCPFLMLGGDIPA